MTGSTDTSRPTAGAMVRAGAARLAAAGIESARLDARLLAAHATGLDSDRLRLHPETAVAPAQRAAFDRLVDRRAGERVPVSRLVGEREFWSLPFRLSPATLDPRPDSETLVEAALGFFPDRAAPVHLLDLGTGAGCLLLALLHELTGAWGLGTDRSAAALDTARDNASRLGLGDRARFAAADWAAPLHGRFDLVVSNPPYIERAAIGGLAPEVARHDPALALDGGADGLDAYHVIAAALPALVLPRGVAILEIGHDQSDAVRALVGQAGFDEIGVRRDLGGRPRCIVACRTA